MRRSLQLWLVLALGSAALGATACEQPYRVFAVQLGTAPAAATLAVAPAAAAGGLPAANDIGALKASHTEWDLNEASAETLLHLPGITVQEVAAIIAGRPYKSKRELVKRKLATAAEYARWKPYLVVHRVPRAAAGGN